jgi:serine/threonine-protein kinase
MPNSASIAVIKSLDPIMFKLKKNWVGKKISRYTISSLIGQGRYGICFLAHSDDGNQVVIKKFKKGLFVLNGRKNEYEAVILSQLQDSRVPELLGVINEQGFYGFVLEYKPGKTIKEMLFKDHHEFSDQEIYAIGAQLIEIIKYLHHHGVVHRDIRLPNVLFRNGKLFLVDFGLARWADDHRYLYSFDFSYLGDFLLYLIYSAFDETLTRSKKTPWYDELNLDAEKTHFLKKLLRLEIPYETVDQIEIDFRKIFSHTS